MQTITTFMGKDHDRLDGLFREFQTLKKYDLTKAELVFSDFKRGLERHITWEEESLFPVFEEQTGMRDRGPTAVMRMEHRQVKALLEQIQNRLLDGASQTDEFEQELLAVLTSHNQKEEMVLYPAIDQELGVEKGEALLARLSAEPGERSERA